MSRPHQPAEIPDDQGALFAVTYTGNGHNDPGNYGLDANITPVDGGFFQDPPAEPAQPAGPDPEVLKAIAASVATDKRHAEQLGRHSMLGLLGSYGQELKPGYFLPGFGPVTRRNLEEANAYAASLERKRLANKNKHTR